MKMNYEKITWRSGFHTEVDPSVAYSELERIRKENDGDLKPEAIVKRAKTQKNPLHPLFEWDDSIAAHEHRLSTARHICRELRVQIVVRKGETTRQRIYQIARTEKAPAQPARNVYRSIDDIMEDPQARAELLQRALRELVAFQRRYRGLQELAIVFRALDEILTSLEP